MSQSSLDKIKRLRSRPPTRGGVGLDRRYITLALLLSVGFGSGFAVSGEVSPMARPDDLVRVHGVSVSGSGGGSGAVVTPAEEHEIGHGGGAGPSADGAGGEERGGVKGGGGAGASAAGGERQAEAGSGAGGAAAGRDPASAGSGGARAGAEGSGAGRPAPAAAAAQNAADKPADRPCRSVDLLGVEAADVLSGNTAGGGRDPGSDPELLYFSPRGWGGRMRASSIELRAWDPGSGALCGPDGRGGSSCETVRVRRCLDAGRDGTHPGDLLRPDGRWIPIRRGRAGGFPDHLPFLDAPRPAQKPSREGFAGGTAYERAGRGDGSPATVVFYAGDGRRFTYPHPSDESLRRGLPVDVGWWTFARGAVCQGDGPSGQHPSCYSPHRGSGGRLTLTSTSHLAAIDLLAVDGRGPVAAEDD